MPSMSHQVAQGASRNARTTPIFPLTSTSSSSVVGAPGSATSNFTPQQLSPNYALSGGSGGGRSTTLFGQRNFPPADRRPMSSIGGSMPAMSGFGIPGRSYGTQSGIAAFHSAFGGSGDSGTPPLLDPSEFPSLTNRGGSSGISQQDNMLQPSPMPGKQPYVGMVKQPTSESSEFTISSEDFPALPGTQAGSKDPSSAAGKSTPQPGGQPPSDQVSEQNMDPGNGASTSRAPGAERPSQQERGVQTHADGRVTNIPSSMVKDQFGIVGLLTFIRVAETEPSLVAMSLGQDLKNLGLNLNSPENIYPNFGGPFADVPCRPQDIDYHVPQEYLVNAAIRDKLPIPKLGHYKEDLLFYFFYCYPGDSVQLAAATELYNRDWRYHMEEKVWISRAPGATLLDKTSSYERGTYLFFDPQKWRRVPKEFLLEYAKLEDRPPLPQTHMYPPPSIPGAGGVM